jgi:hypothetical protein
VKEAPGFAPALRILPSGKYLAFKTLAQSEFGSAINLHTCFANIAKLKEWRSLNPIPPSIFGKQSFHQEYQCIFYLDHYQPTKTKQSHQ